jgi:hypothetical protein
MATIAGEAFRDCMVGIVDCARTIADDDFCVRRYEVKTRLRVWGGPQRGQGGFTDTDTTFAPRPKVHESAPRWMHSNAGKVEEGDRFVDKLSGSLTIDQLTGGKLGPLEEFIWLLSGKDGLEEAYAVVSEPDERYVDWRVHLRRMNRVRRS